VIAQIIIGIVLGLLALYVKARADAPASTIQPRQPALRDRLLRRVRDAGWTIALVATSAILSGCYAPAVYIPTGEPVRIARPIRHATVEILLPSGQTALRTLTIPAGWYALPDPAEASGSVPAAAPAAVHKKEQP
jgi:hypothetical protein